MDFKILKQTKFEFPKKLTSRFKSMFFRNGRIKSNECGRID